MYKTGTAVVNEADVLQPAVVPAPGEPHWEDESRVYEGEKQIVVDVGSFCDGASGYLGHHDAEGEVEDEHCVVGVGVVDSDEVGLTH